MPVLAGVTERVDNEDAQNTASILVHRRRHAKKADPRSGGGSVRARVLAKWITKSTFLQFPEPPRLTERSPVDQLLVLAFFVLRAR